WVVVIGPLPAAARGGDGGPGGGPGVSGAPCSAYSAIAAIAPSTAARMTGRRITAPDPGYSATQSSARTPVYGVQRAAVCHRESQSLTPAEQHASHRPCGGYMPRDAARRWCADLESYEMVRAAVHRAHGYVEATLRSRRGDRSAAVGGAP